MKAAADTERRTAGLVLAYDGECPMCDSMSRACRRLGLVEERNRRSYLDFEGELSARLWEAGIHNEMIVLDPETGAMKSGADGILWLLERSRLSALARLLQLPPLRAVLTLAYRLVSYNRRALALPRPAGGGPGTPRCACDPDDRPLYQGLFTALCALLAVGLTALLGVAAARATGLASAGTGAAWTLLAAGSG